MGLYYFPFTFIFINLFHHQIEFYILLNLVSFSVILILISHCIDTLCMLGLFNLMKLF